MFKGACLFVVCLAVLLTVGCANKVDVRAKGETVTTMGVSNR